MKKINNTRSKVKNKNHRSVLFGGFLASKSRTFNKRTASIFMILFAATGSYFIYSSFAVVPVCNKTLTTGGNVQTFIDSVTAGQMGCLPSGTYNIPGTLYFRNAGATITSSDPAARASINGYSEVSRGADGVTISGLNLTTTGLQHTIRIYGNNTILEKNDITDNQQPNAGACIGIGGSQDRPSGVVIRLNKIHNCGSTSDNLNHGIYANNFTNLTITDNLFWSNYAYNIQLYPNADSATVSHNVLDGSNDENAMRGGIIIDGTSTGHTIDHNVIVNVSPATAAITARTGTNQSSSNCFYNNSAGNTSDIPDSGSITANPNFISRAGRDYRLQTGSLCLAIVQYDTAAKLASAWSEGTTPPPTSDITPPNVSVTSPINGSTISGTSAYFSASAADSVGGSGIAGVQFKYNGNNLGAEDTLAPYSISADSTTVTDGSYSITAVARDIAGNSTTSNPVIVNVNNSTVSPPSDTVAPVTTISSPLNGATVGNWTAINARATDNVGVVRMQLYVRGKLLQTVNANSLSYNWKSQKQYGSSVITVKSYDAGGNLGEKSITVYR